LPAGNGLSNLAANAGIMASGISMLTTASTPDPLIVIVETSAGPSNNPRSEGLMGVASTLISTSPSLGCGIGTDTSDSSNLPALVIFVRNCSDFSSLKILSFYINLCGSAVTAHYGAMKFFLARDAVTIVEGEKIGHDNRIKHVTKPTKMVITIVFSTKVLKSSF
jgi:hypothetical protein